MSRTKTSIVWQIPREQLQALLDESDSIVQVLVKLGLDPYNGNHKTVHARVKQDQLSLEAYKTNRRAARRRHMDRIRFKQPDAVAFSENSTYHRNHLKARIIQQGLIPYRCAECGIGGEYNGRPLCLQLDHINGVNNDNRLENLRFLCPNCHSQTETFSGKGKFKKAGETPEQKEIRLAARRVFDPSREELEKMVRTMPMTRVGKHYGVTDNAVRKRCRKLGIEL